MENSDMIMIASVIIISILGTVLFYQRHSQNKPKTSTKNAVDDGIKQMQDVYTQMITDLKAQNKTLQASVNRYKGLVAESDEEEEPEQDLLQNPLLQAAAQKYGINPALLQTPEAQKFIKKNKEYIPIVLQFLATRSDPNQPAFGQAGVNGLQTV